MKNHRQQKPRPLVLLLILLATFAVHLFAEAPRTVIPSQAYPGDPLFISLDFAQNNQHVNSLVAELWSKESKKPLQSAQFFSLTKKGVQLAWSAAMPLSTFLPAGRYTIIIKYIMEDSSYERQYPIQILAKRFASETIYLNAQNTAIRTDSSPQRKTQIDRLNQVLFSYNPAALWHTKAFVHPVESRRRTGFFGDRRVFKYSNGTKATSVHYGIDYGIPTGTPVFSCGRGKVVLAEERISTGFTVVVEHQPGLFSLYYHLDSYSVHEGQMLETGEQLGLSGATGLATGPHLHWEVRLLGSAVNPDFFIDTFADPTLHSAKGIILENMPDLPLLLNMQSGAGVHEKTSFFGAGTDTP